MILEWCGACVCMCLSTYSSGVGVCIYGKLLRKAYLNGKVWVKTECRADKNTE